MMPVQIVANRAMTFRSLCSGVREEMLQHAAATGFLCTGPMVLFIPDNRQRSIKAEPKESPELSQFIAGLFRTPLGASFEAELSHCSTYDQKGRFLVQTMHPVCRISERQCYDARMMATMITISGLKSSRLCWRQGTDRHCIFLCLDRTKVIGALAPMWK